ncbi:hypothetical protein GGI24_003235 [Coemansia furcata]|nr:hypothetical protein GGI24_003235 [Coemansia furcata]
MDELGLVDEFDRYEETTSGVFAEIIHSVPTLNKTQLESSFVKGLLDVLKLMCELVEKVNLPQQSPKMPHLYYNC